MKSLGKIRTKLQLLYRQNDFYRQNDVGCCVIQVHFDYTFNSWYLLFSQKIKQKIQLTQHKYICFCLKLSSKQHIRWTEISYKNCEIRTLLLPKYKSWLQVCLLIPAKLPHILIMHMRFCVWIRTLCWFQLCFCNISINCFHFLKVLDRFNWSVMHFYWYICYWSSLSIWFKVIRFMLILLVFDQESDDLVFQLYWLSLSIYSLSFSIFMIFFNSTKYCKNYAMTFNVAYHSLNL